MKILKIIAILLLFVNLLVAQKNQNYGGKPNMAIGRVYGKVIDENKKAVAYASVTLFQTKGAKDSLISGALTEDNGEFNLTELPFGRFKLKITYVGYKDFAQQVGVRPPDFVEQDLGDIKLEIDSKVLNEVSVTAEKSQSQLTLDKQVFNVGRNAAAVGGTAEDVLKAVPSVSLDSDGNAKLRNNGTTIYLDGRPTPLSLNQIPADEIDRVEVITNPSAKYEAQTSGGIINIVSKKNKKPGYNGLITLGAATGNRYNGTLSLSYRQGKNSFTGFYNRNQSNQPSTGYTHRTNLRNGQVQNYFDQINDGNFDNFMQMGSLAWERQINNRNTMTLTGNYRSGQHNMMDRQSFVTRSANLDTTSTGLRTIEPDNGFYNVGGALNWKKTFPKKGKELIFDVMYNRMDGSNAATWTTKNYFASGTQLIQTNKITGNNVGDNIVFQLDYANPINDSTKIEYGVRSSFNGRNQQYFNDLYDENGKLTRLNDFSQDFKVNDWINGVYINYSSRWKGIGYQAGLRYEQSNLNATSKIAGKDFGYNYPSSSKDIFKALFPSVYLSKKFNASNELQFNLSRKINRPNFMQLMPVIRAADVQNIQVGNPALKPEFINLAEINYNKLFKNNNWLSSLYFRDEQNAVMQYATPSALDSSILINSFINGTRTFRFGLDNTLKLELFKKLELTTNVNAFNLVFKTQSLTRQGFAMNGKVNANYKLPKDFSLQATYNYESPRIFLQGKEKENQFLDLAFKKDITVGTFASSKRGTSIGNTRIGSVIFSVSDVFNTRRNLRHFDTTYFIQDLQRRRDLRFFKITIQTYFGKPDASLFKRKKTTSSGGEGMQEF